jgi:hypothetical protein
MTIEELVINGSSNVDRQPWQSMKLTLIGQVSEIVRGGGGKLSIPTDDMGDYNKPKGQE